MMNTGKESPISNIGNELRSLRHKILFEMRRVGFKTISVNEMVANQQTLSSVIVKSLVLNV